MREGGRFTVSIADVALALIAGVVLYALIHGWG
jgi:hypothetical protein